MIDKLLLAVDGSRNSQRATELGGELAAKLNADLFIVHVLMHGRPSKELVHMAEVEHLVQEAYTIVSPGLSYTAGSHPELLGGAADDARTAQIISALGDQIVRRAMARCKDKGAKHVKTSVRSGDVAEEILKTATTHHADMIIVGTRGLGTLKSTVLGSVSQKVLHHAECAVVTVR